MAKVTERKIVGLTVKYSDSSTSSYSLAEPLTEKSKTELREVVAEFLKRFVLRELKRCLMFF
jgi:hypothetical protein